MAVEEGFEASGVSVAFGLSEELVGAVVFHAEEAGRDVGFVAPVESLDVGPGLVGAGGYEAGASIV